MILSKLPPFENKRVLIKKRQDVSDIMQETLNAHDFFAADYDKIAPLFLGGSQLETLKKLFNFLKLNVEYREESERMQQTKSPAAILETGFCDCKCYALFIGGVLDALTRAGEPFTWNYAYASYQKGVRTPGHVFVQALVNGNEVWIDPVLSHFDKRFPVPEYIIKKKKRTDMSLYRLTGIGEIMTTNVTEVPTNTPVTIQPAGIGEWIKQNPGYSALIGIGIIYLITRKRKKRR